MDPVSLPQSALERLRQAKAGAANGSGKQLFSGDFTARDLLLLKQANFKPVGLVFGASVMFVSFTNAAYWSVGSISTYSEGYQEAIHNAIVRMQEETKLLGADGVINIVAKISGFTEHEGLQFGSQNLMVTLMGTAVQYIGPADTSRFQEAPFMTELNADGFCGLLRTGHFPTGLAAGATVQMAVQYSLGSGFKPFEEPNLTRTIYYCREECQKQAEGWAAAHGSSGIVNMRLFLRHHEVDRGQNSASGYIFIFALCLGTCVKHFVIPESQTALAKGEKFVLPLN